MPLPRCSSPKTPLPTIQSLSKSRDRKAAVPNQRLTAAGAGASELASAARIRPRRDAWQAAAEHADAPDDQPGVHAVGAQAGAPGRRRRRRRRHGQAGARTAVLLRVGRRGRDGRRRRLPLSRAGRLRRADDHRGVPVGLRLLRQAPRPGRGHLHLQGRGGILQPGVQGASDQERRAHGTELHHHIHPGGAVGPVRQRRLGRRRGRCRRRIVGRPLAYYIY
ncbi:hypothetical protein ACQJBY_058091 [Aegilops geniculata]